MKLQHPLTPGRLLSRYKRFLADVELSDGTVVTAHCPNSGSMLGCAAPGSPVFLSRSDNPSRKLPYTWELVHADACWVGINTGLPNRLVREGIEHTLVEDGVARFPDAVTTRGQKHLRELMAMVKSGARSVNFFVVQHAGARAVAPADSIDPAYGSLLRQAAMAGVELLAYQASVTPTDIALCRALPIVLP